MNRKGEKRKEGGKKGKKEKGKKERKHSTLSNTCWERAVQITLNEAETG